MSQHSSISESDIKRERSRLAIPIVLGIFSTLGWVGLAMYHVFVTHDGLVEVSNLELNEFGDFLAGVFAPLAFLWLVVAVFVQKDELRAQLVEFQRSYELQMRALEKSSIDGKFIYVSTLGNKFAKLLNLERVRISELVTEDKHDEAIKELNRRLSESANMSSKDVTMWESKIKENISNIESIDYYLSLLMDEIDLILKWQKIYKNDEVRSRILDSDLSSLRVSLEAISFYLEDVG